MPMSNDQEMGEMGDPNEAMEQGEPQATGGPADLTAKAKAQIKVPPEMKSAYERIVLAGMKVMFSQETHKMMLQELQGEGPIEQRLAKGIAGLMAILWKQSNQTMPPQLVVPAAMELLLEAIDFINESGQEEVDEQTIGEAIRLTIGAVLQQFGVNEETVKQAAAQEGGQPPAGGEGQPPAEGGIVGNAMGA